MILMAKYEEFAKIYFVLVKQKIQKEMVYDYDLMKTK